MANNLIQVKRTSVSGRAPNTSTLANPGELALNMTDGILYSTNGSVIFEVGANNTNVRVSNNLTLDNDVRLTFKTVNTSAHSSLVNQSDDNFVFYVSNTSGGERPVWSIYANSVTSNLQIQVPLQLNSGVVANGSLGTNGFVLTTNGSGVYWASALAGSVDQNGQYYWTNTHNFEIPVSFGNSTVNTTVNSTAFSGTANNANNLGGVAAASYIQNTDSRTLSGNLIFSGANVVYDTGFSVGANVVLTTSKVTVGNSTVNTVVNSTAFSGSLVLSGNSTIIANGSAGAANYVLTSNGNTPYWALAPGSVYNIVSSNAALNTLSNYLVDTSGGAVYVSLPSSPTQGYWVEIGDGGGDKFTAPAVVQRNGSTINNEQTDIYMDVPNTKAKFIYTGTTWKVFVG